MVEFSFWIYSNIFSMLTRRANTSKLESTLRNSLKPCQSTHWTPLTWIERETNGSVVVDQCVAQIRWIVPVKIDDKDAFCCRLNPRRFPSNQVKHDTWFSRHFNFTPQTQTRLNWEWSGPGSISVLFSGGHWSIGFFYVQLSGIAFHTGCISTVTQFPVFAVFVLPTLFRTSLMNLMCLEEVLHGRCTTDANSG